MKVLYFLGSFPNLSETFILNEIYELEKRGHNVAVFALNKSDDDIKHKELDELDLDVYYADQPGIKNIRELLSPKLMNKEILKNIVFFGNPKYHTAILHRAKQGIEFVNSLDYEIDHVHGHFISKDKITAQCIADYFNVGCTATGHAFEFFADPNKRWMKMILDKLDHVVTVTDYNKRFIQREFDYEKDISVIPVSIRTDKFEPQHDEKENRLVSIARLVEKKGLRYGIRAIKELKKCFPEIEYHIIGSGPLHQELQKEIESNNLEENVKLLGNVSDERLIKEVKESQLSLLPCIIASDGDRDSGPMVIKESMAMETPVISTDISGIPEIIDDGEDGILVSSKNVDELSDAIKELLESEEKRKQMGKRARKKVEEKFSLEKQVDSLERVFEKVSKDGK